MECNLYDTLPVNNQKDLSSMHLLRAYVRAIDAFSARSGQLLAWLVLCMAFLTTCIVVLRYGFNIGSIAAQDAVIYMHGCVFMLGVAEALKNGSHVRVDIFYRSFSPRARAWVNSVGGVVLLLPTCVFIFAISFSYVANSWSILESSAESGGIPAVFALKTLIPLMALNLFLQGLAETLRNALFLVGEES